MGTVYRARHTLLEQDFAVKVLAGGLAEDSEVRRRFLVEARSLASFVHRNAVQVRDCGQDGGVLYLAMDLCPGETLAELSAREGPLAPARAVTIVVQILDALDEAHRAGIVHRDLKPGNVMVEVVHREGRPSADVVRVVDFGLARIVGAGRGALPDAFTSIGGDVVGTVAYMSPEQLRAADDVDGRSDLFSLGVVLYELLAGSSPFPGTSTMSIALRIVDARPAPWPATIAPRVGPALDAVLARALEKRPEDRFATAAEMAAALRTALAEGSSLAGDAGAGTTAARVPTGTPAAALGPSAGSARDPDRRPSVAPAPAPAPARRGRRALALVGVVALAAAVGLWWTRARADDAVRSTRARAQVAAAEGRHADAVAAYSDLIDLLPRDGEAFLGRARARAELSDRNAPADLDEADRLLRDDPRVATVRGRYAWRVEKDGAKADQAFVRALTLDPDDLEARFERAVSELDRGLPALVEQDAAAMERRAPGDARVPWLRAQSRVRAAIALGRDPSVEALATEAVVAAQAASDRDARWADGASVLASALSQRAYDEKNRGDYDGARATLDAAAAAATLAITRATAEPGYRGQGGTLARRYYDRAGVRFQQRDNRAALADLDAALDLAPRDPNILSQRAYALQQTGDHEGAIRDFARLYDVTNDVDHLFRQGFGWQRLGEGRADVGDRAGALAAYTEAILVYGSGVARAPERETFAVYRGETHTRYGRWLTGSERDARWSAAESDFATALAAAPGDSETLLRRAELWLARGLAARAYDDVRVAVGGRKDMTPRYYLRLAKAALLRSREDLSAGRHETARAFAAEAVEQASRARGLMPEALRDVGPLLVEAENQSAAVARDAGEATLHFERAESVLTEIERLAPEDPGVAARSKATAAYLRAGAALVRGEASVALRLAQDAVDLRAEEATARRWYEDALFVERLADALAATGDAAGAKAARERAAGLPR